MTRRTLVTGGVRSGKSTYAEDLLADVVGVTYVATGQESDPEVDADWAARVAKHQLRRPAHWRTVETFDIAPAIETAPGAVLLDCLGTWLTATIDDIGGWDRPLAAWEAEYERRLQAVLDAWSSATGPLVAVTNEVGFGVVPEHQSGRLFRDLLGTTNQRLARECDDVVFVVAGRALKL